MVVKHINKIKILTASQLCALLGISRYSLKQYYVLYKLPIEDPFAKKGQGYSRYSYEDVERVKCKLEAVNK